MQQTFSRRHRPTLVAAPLLIALLLGGCGDSKPAVAAAKKGGGASPVVVAQAKKKIVPLAIDAIGAVEPIRGTTVRSQVTGVLMRIAIREGQAVQKDDLLFEIDPRPFQNALVTAEADLKKVKLQLESARAQVARYKSLTTDQMVSKEAFDKISDTARTLEAEMLSGESKVANARLQLEYCSIRAPLAGRTGHMPVREGDLVRANEAGGVLVTINQLSPISVSFGVPQQYLGAINRYSASGHIKVRAVPPGGDESPEEGELSFVDNTVDSATGTLRLKGTFANAAQRLWPAQFVNVTVTLAAPEALTVPGSALQTSQAGQFVYVVKADKTAEQRPVTVERHYAGEAVIAKGLTEGETIVTEGQLRVVPGRPVEVKQPGGPAKAPKKKDAPKDGDKTEKKKQPNA
ncbi:MAG: efflux RND transporter periplasmic adaptor subunit [Opitutaceae bacterium]|nr:efflux RND transporter periplasmic adaptor subunit [Opitutaceae bacterium]